MVEFSTLLQFIQAFGIIVGVAYYIMNIQNNQRNQELTLETRQAQLFMNIHDSGLQRQNLRAQSNVLDMKFESIEEFEEKYGKENNPEAYLDMGYVLDYMEGIGVLVREGYVSIRLVALLNGGFIKYSWEKFMPFIKAFREKYNWPRWYIEFEYLYDSLMKYAEEHPELQITQ